MSIFCIDKEAVQIQINSSVRLPIRFEDFFLCSMNRDERGSTNELVSTLFMYIDFDFC